MLPPLFTHKRYLRFVRKQARRHHSLCTNHRHFHPTGMFRSWLAMMECGVTSVDVWVSMMHDDSFYAIISGFDPCDIPGVGTFFDFQDRLLKRLRQPRTTQRRPFHRRTQRDRAQHHKDKNDLRPHQGILQRLADRLLARTPHVPALTDVLQGTADLSALPEYQQTLQAIFYACFVSRSVDLKLIDLHGNASLHVAGDGTKLPTWANPHGKKRCSCDNRGKKPQDRCRCPRAYRDPWALWGWDSYRQCWVYGYSLYELTAYSTQHACQLPLVVSIADCNRHDSVHGLAALYHGCETLALPIRVASLDAAHDAIGLFRLATQRWHMALVVPLNERNKDHLQYAAPLGLDNDVPVCPAGLPMTRWGFCPDRLRIKWRCPLAAAKKTPHITACPHFGHDCSGSPYGRVVYTYPKENYRLHTLIPRDSPLWKTHEDARSCAERSVKRKKHDFLLLQTRTAGRDRWFFRIILAAMCQHIDAWLIHAPNRLN
jgi:hypothetical protein